MTLYEILDLMRSLEGMEPEHAHARADQLLLETIHCLYTRTGYIAAGEEARYVPEIVASYNRVSKWYA